MHPPATLLLGPAVALAVVGLLAVLSRWTFGERRARGNKRPGSAYDVPDYGLLVPVTRALPRAEAQWRRDRLALHGIRVTIAPAGPGYDAAGRPWPPDATHVLVFPDDEPLARALLPR